MIRIQFKLAQLHQASVPDDDRDDPQPQRAYRARRGGKDVCGQELTLAHFSAQPEPLLAQNKP